MSIEAALPVKPEPKLEHERLEVYGAALELREHACALPAPARCVAVAVAVAVFRANRPRSPTPTFDGV